MIAFDIGLEFRLPELPARCGSRCIAATLMVVPEAPMNEDHCPIFGKHEIGAAGKASVVKAEAKAARVQFFSQAEFRLRILPPDISHHSGSGLGVDDVDQLVFSWPVRCVLV